MKRWLLNKLISIFANARKCQCPKSAPRFGKREGKHLRCDRCGGLYELPYWVLEEPNIERGR